MTMLPMIFALLVTVWTGWMILRRYKPQAILLFSGLLLTAFAMIFGPDLNFVSAGSLTQGQSTGSRWIDLFAHIRQLFSSRAAGIGLTIMAIAGFAKYMDHIGASRALVGIAVKPLTVLKSPYIALSICFVLGVIINIFIPSASGLGLLLMVTMYPVLIRLGVSKLSATAVIASCTFIDLGPASGTANFASQVVGIDVMTYFISHQIPVSIAVVLAGSTAHFFLQRFYDKKDGHISDAVVKQIQEEKGEDAANAPPPKIYALLPVIPLVLLFVFSDLFNMPYRIDIVTAMIVCLALSMLAELIRLRDPKKVLASIQVFFDGMGVSFATVITLIVAGEVFANGLIMSGAITGVIEGAQALGISGGAFTAVMSGIVATAAVLMGSGNAPFFAFAGLVPDVSAAVGVSAVSMILPMQFATSIARSVSPIAAVIIAVAGVAGLSPIDVVKRTAVPMAISMVVTLIASAIFL